MIKLTPRKIDSRLHKYRYTHIFRNIFALAQKHCWNTRRLTVTTHWFYVYKKKRTMNKQNNFYLWKRYTWFIWLLKQIFIKTNNIVNTYKQNGARVPFFNSRKLNRNAYMLECLCIEYIKIETYSWLKIKFN